MCGGVFFIFWGWVWGIQFLFLIGGGGIFTFFKLTGSGGHHNCFLGGGGVCKKVPPALPPLINSGTALNVSCVYVIKQYIVLHCLKA